MSLLHHFQAACATPGGSSENLCREIFPLPMDDHVRFPLKIAILMGYTIFSRYQREANSNGKCYQAYRFTMIYMKDCAGSHLGGPSCAFRLIPCAAFRTLLGVRG